MHKCRAQVTPKAFNLQQLLPIKVCCHAQNMQNKFILLCIFPSLIALCSYIKGVGVRIICQLNFDKKYNSRVTEIAVRTFDFSWKILSICFRCTHTLYFKSQTKLSYKVFIKQSFHSILFKYSDTFATDTSIMPRGPIVFAKHSIAVDFKWINRPLNNVHIVYFVRKMHSLFKARVIECNKHVPRNRNEEKKFTFWSQSYRRHNS